MSSANLSAVEQARVARLVSICSEIDAALKNGAPKMATLKRFAAQHHATPLIGLDGKEFILKLKFSTLRRIYDRWKTTAKTHAIARQHSGGMQSVPRDLIGYLRMLATREGIPTASVAINTVLKEWSAGIAVPGLGTWQEWFHGAFPDQPVPAVAPKFPYHPGTLYRYLPKKKSALAAAGNLGLAAALDFMFSVERDSSKLKVGEVYTCDDVRLDLVCHDTLTGKTTEVRAYVMMEWGTRRIVAYTMRAGNALTKADMRAMLARGLRAGGIRPPGEITHIFTERGTCVLDAADMEHLALITDGRVQVHQTSMISGERWAGAGNDRPVGNFRGKAVLESFFRRLHIRLGYLPGQRGNRYEKAPANLDFAGQHEKRRKGSGTEYDDLLATIDRSQGGRLKLDLKMLWENELEEEFATAIKEYNAARGHGMQGFGQVTVAVTPEGTLHDVPALSADSQSRPTTEGTDHGN